ncbi:hypothetical protein [Hymenobacter persicinus]|uniref:Uncharacterized protein n=1 Tax=Hymenobacter persicinus TaxID=2025506 RepID=A0A4Q5LEK7_9BACT|nr:hypothetical protein [Hymenobacter persicinus]RYU82409.1 hypothetical protein EWM57_04300 [Hymenobacter persicinus]
MEVRRPYTRRNVICAALLGLVAAAYWLFIWWLTTDMQRAAAQGARGEAAGLFLAVLFPLALYSSLFFFAAFSSALQRGSRPMSYWLLALGLLPTLLLTGLLGAGRWLL